MEDKKARLEAALYISEEPLDKDEISDALNVGSMGYVDMVIDEVKEDLDEENRGLELVESPEGFEIKVKPEHLNQVRHLAANQDMSEAAMRTLSIIAYNAPVDQSKIVKIRGNRAYAHVKETVKKGFVSKEKDGRTSKLDVTEYFMDYFDLDSRKELSSLAEETAEIEV